MCLYIFLNWISHLSFNFAVDYCLHNTLKVLSVSLCNRCGYVTSLITYIGSKNGHFDKQTIFLRLVRKPDSRLSTSATCSAQTNSVKSKFFNLLSFIIVSASFSRLLLLLSYLLNSTELWSYRINDFNLISLHYLGQRSVMSIELVPCYFNSKQIRKEEPGKIWYRKQ